MASPAQMPRKIKVELPQPPAELRGKNTAMFHALRQSQLKNHKLASGR